MDLIKYLEHAAVEADAVWRSGDIQDQPGSDMSRAGFAFADNAALAELLDARPTMICMVVAPDDGETEMPDEAQDDPVSPESTSDGEDSDRSSQG